MSVKNNCLRICEEIRRRGFEESGMTAVIPEDVLENIVKDQQWSQLTKQRYIRAEEGYLVQFGYLRVVEGGYELTGEDLKHD